VSAEVSFHYRKEREPTERGYDRIIFIAERPDGVAIAELKQHHEGPLATMWSYRDDDIEAIFFGDVEMKFISVDADGLPRGDEDVEVTFRLPRGSFVRQNGPALSDEKADIVWRNIADAFRTWPTTWNPVPVMRLNEVVIL
jgi:hypothetical protein